MNIAGTCCQGWSVEGHQKRSADPSERPHAIWLCEREMAARLDLEDAFIQDCATKYDTSKILKTMHETHHTCRVMVCPKRLGYLANHP